MERRRLYEDSGRLGTALRSGFGLLYRLRLSILERLVDHRSDLTRGLACQPALLASEFALPAARGMLILKHWVGLVHQCGLERYPLGRARLAIPLPLQESEHE